MCCEALGDLGDRGVPVDLLVAAVGAAAHRRGQPGAVVLVVVEPQRLVAGVALRRRMLLVAADLGERAVFESARRCRSCTRTGCTRWAAIHRSSFSRLIGPFGCGQRRVVYIPGVSPELFSISGKTALITRRYQRNRPDDRRGLSTRRCARLHLVRANRTPAKPPGSSSESSARCTRFPPTSAARSSAGR